MNNEYPTEEALETIRNWDVTKAVELMQFVKENWWCPGFGWCESIDPDTNITSYSLSTGGWSGNESIISALERNRVFWASYWQSSSRGGHFVFMIPNDVICTES